MPRHCCGNMLASAQLLSDRLAMMSEPSVKALAPRLIASLDRAITLCDSTLRFGRAEEAPPRRELFMLHALVKDVGDSLSLPREGTITCVAQAEFNLPQPAAPNGSDKPPMRRPLAPVWIEIGADSTTIGFRSELPPSAAIYIGQETPCGPRVIGVRLGDLLKWLADPQTATKRDFLGMVSAGCPDATTLR